MTDLKPCPFCRSDVTKEYPAEIKHEGTYFNVWARCCDFYGPLHDSEEQAIAAWNRRATPAPAQPDPLRVANERGEGEPVAWVRRHPDGSLTAELLPNAMIEPVRKTSGGWLPLYPLPAAPKEKP